MSSVAWNRRPAVTVWPRPRGLGPPRSAGPAWRSSAYSQSASPRPPAGPAAAWPSSPRCWQQATESLVPGPVLPTQIGGLVLAPLPGSGRGAACDAGADGWRALRRGRAQSGSLAGSWQPDGSLSLRGQVGQVLGGGRHDAPACQRRRRTPTPPTRGAVWCLLPVTAPGITLAECAPADFSRPLADLSMSGVVAGPDQILTGISTEQVRDLAATLFAVEAAAVANWCARTAAEYARIRHQFGRPIGSFQAVKHLCATMLCRAETAAVLAWDAARAVDDAPDELPLAAAAAAAVNLDTAVDTAKDCIQVLGGIGFTWEHDAHLYLRRAVALRQLLGGSAPWRDRTARLALSGVRRRLRLDDAGTSARTGCGAAGDGRDSRRWCRRQLPPDGQRRVLADSGLRGTSLAAAVRAGSVAGRAAHHRRRARPGGHHQARHCHRRLGHSGDPRPRDQGTG